MTVLSRANVGLQAEGRAAHAAGLPLNANPYAPRSMAWRQWARGWHLAREKCDPLAAAARLMDAQPVPAEGRVLWPPGWCPICGGQDGEHKPGCEPTPGDVL